jgi:hypothetical protein
VKTSLLSKHDLSISVMPTRAAHFTQAAAATFLVLFVALHILEPEFDPSWRFLSEYTLGRFGWMMVLAFLSLAAGCVGLFLTLRSYLTTIGGKIGLGFVWLGVLGFTMSALFTTDPITAGVDALSTSGQLHGWGAMFTDGLAVGAVLITWVLGRQTAWTPARWAMIGTLLVIVFSEGWIVAAMPSNAQFGPDVHIGWPGRLLMVAYSVWLMTAAWGALQIGKRNA